MEHRVISVKGSDSTLTSIFSDANISDAGKTAVTRICEEGVLTIACVGAACDASIVFNLFPSGCFSAAGSGADFTSTVCCAVSVSFSGIGVGMEGMGVGSRIAASTVDSGGAGVASGVGIGTTHTGTVTSGIGVCLRV